MFSLFFFHLFWWTFNASHSKHFKLSIRHRYKHFKLSNAQNKSIEASGCDCLLSARTSVWLKRLLASPGMSLHALIHSSSLTRSFYSPACLFLCETWSVKNCNVNAVSLFFFLRPSFPAIVRSLATFLVQFFSQYSKGVLLSPTTGSVSVLILPSGCLYTLPFSSAMGECRLGLFHFIPSWSDWSGSSCKPSSSSMSLIVRSIGTGCL